MRIIRELTEGDSEAYVTIAANAYPGSKVVTAADRQRYWQRNKQMRAEPMVSQWGLFADGRLLGAMRLFDFAMTLHETSVLVGGIGGVAVDLVHKKRKVAYDMLQFSLNHYREKGAALVALYPFRPDFYHQMGFGYSAKMNHYRVKPASLPRSASDQVVFLTETDKAALLACYGRYAQQTHGMMSRPAYAWENLLTEPGRQIIGYKAAGQIQGYLIFDFQVGPADNFLSNDILVRELVYENQAALAGLLSFLHNQADQIERIIINTQDDDFHFLLADPRFDGELMSSPILSHQSNTQGIGLMVRVIDVPRLFGQLVDHNFGGQTCRFKLTVRDSFFPNNAGSWVVEIENGRVRFPSNQKYDVAIELDVAPFSSLVMGTVSFRQLAAYGLAAITDSDYIDMIDHVFHTRHKPVCMTSF